MNNKLTAKEERFVQGLFSGLSQRKAYKEAYNPNNMTDKSVDEEACRLAKEVKISSRLKELTEKQAKETGWTVEKLIKEFEEIKQMCKCATPVLDRQGEATGEYKFDSTGAVKSLENIGKLLGMYTEKVQHSGNIGVRIVDDIEEDDEDD